MPRSCQCARMSLKKWDMPLLYSDRPLSLGASSPHSHLSARLGKQIGQDPGMP